MDPVRPQRETHIWAKLYIDHHHQVYLVKRRFFSVDTGATYWELTKLPSNGTVYIIIQYISECKEKVKFTLEEATNAQRESTGIALLFSLGAR